jgi:hypothetical protein
VAASAITMLFIQIPLETSWRDYAISAARP